MESGERTVAAVNVEGGGPSQLESLKRRNQFGAEYWSARDIQQLLGYADWRHFLSAIKKAVKSCDHSGNVSDNHFVGAAKMITLGKGGMRSTKDYHLSRFACYLIAQNGDPRKPEVAQAQKYFAIQTRRMEISDQLAADRERLELRQQMKSEFKALSGVARQSGVQDKMFGLFHDAGYRGLYDGLGREQIKKRKGIPRSDELLDRMGATELAANNFRLTQTKDKLAREKVKDQEAAIRTHFEVGQEVRKAIAQIGGTQLEELPAAEHIKVVEKRLRSSKPKLALRDEDAKGLLVGPSDSRQVSIDDL